MFKSLIPWRKSQETDLAASDPISELSQFRANFDRMLNEFWRPEEESLWNTRWGCDVQDAEDELIVRAEAPGFEPDEIDVKLTGNRLVVQAEHKSESGNGNGQETRYGKLYHSLSVPSGIEADKIQASYKNGMLEVHLPKGEASRSKRIAVTAK